MITRFALAFALLPGLTVAQTQVAQLVTPSAARAGSVQAGVAAAVQGPVQRVTDGVGEILQSGRQIFMGDRIVSGPQSSLQVLLMDQTVFTLGPDSEMVVDEFVYRPDGSGTVTASVTKGTFRFVTGLVAKNRPSDMTIKVPTATIGIRGTMGAGSVGPAQTQIVLLGPGPRQNGSEFIGRLVVSNAAGSVSLSRPGFGTTIGGPNQTPSAPSLFTPQQIAAMGGTAGGGNTQGGGGQASAQNVNTQAGQTQAAAGLFLGPISQLNDAQTPAPETTTAPAASSGIAAGVTTWEQLRTVSTGAFEYGSPAAVPLVPQTGSVGNGFYYMTARIDLGARTTSLAFSGYYNLGSVPTSGYASNFNFTETNRSYATDSGPAASLYTSNNPNDMPYFSLSTSGHVVQVAAQVRNTSGAGGLAALLDHKVQVTNGIHTLVGQGTEQKSVVP